VTATAALKRIASSEIDSSQQAIAGRRVFDASNSVWMVKLFPGELYVTGKADETIVTVLGSCVAACIRDPLSGMAGMNHFMLPQHGSGQWGADSGSARFGNFAMEKLINELLKAGCARERLEVKVFGGGNVTDTSNAVGSDNAEFVLRYLAMEGLRCVAQDLGGALPRRIHYYPATGRVVRRLLGLGDIYDVTRTERTYSKRLLAEKSTGGDIELFGDAA
jgi:chemotaxis protein CheD